MIRTILCPVDLTDLSRCAVRVAGEMASHFGARVVVHHNVDAAPPSSLAVAWMWSEDHEHQAEEKIAEAGLRLEALFSLLPGIEVEGKLTRGPLDATVQGVVRETSTDLLVIATHGRSAPAHDSETEQIVLRAPCPVLALGEDCKLLQGEVEGWLTPGRELPVVVPTDFTPLSQRAVTYALMLAEVLPLELHLVHALGDTAHSDDAERKAVARLRGLIPESFLGRAAYSAAAGRPEEVILGLAREIGARFILMTAHKKGPLRRAVFGTTTLGVLHSSPVPIWFVPDREGLGSAFAAVLRASVE